MCNTNEVGILGRSNTRWFVDASKRRHMCFRPVRWARSIEKGTELDELLDELNLLVFVKGELVIKRVEIGLDDFMTIRLRS